MGITFKCPLISASVEYISDHLLHAYWLNYFSRAEGVPKAIENVEICGVSCPFRKHVEILAVYCPLFNFALC